MQQLASLFQERLGMSEELSTKASTLAFEFMKEQLPDSIAPHLDTLIASDNLGDAVKGAIGSKLGGLGSMFGGGGD